MTTCTSACSSWPLPTRRVVAGAAVGGTVSGASDCWSDLDLTFGVADGSLVAGARLSATRAGRFLRQELDKLPGSVLASFEDVLVRSLDREALLRALAATVSVLLSECADVVDAEMIETGVSELLHED